MAVGFLTNASSRDSMSLQMSPSITRCHDASEWHVCWLCALVFPAIALPVLKPPLQLIMHAIRLLREPKNLIQIIGI